MKRTTLFGCLALALLSTVCVSAQTLGTAKGTATLYTGGAGLPTGDEPTGTVNYRIVDDGTYFWAFYTTSDNCLADGWAVQLRNWGIDGASSREMNLEQRPTTTTAYINTATDHTADAEYYKLTRNVSGIDADNKVTKMQVYAAFTNSTYNCSPLFDYTVGSINNPTSDTQAPTLNTATCQLNAAGDSVIITLSASDNSNDYFYYIYDTQNSIAYVSFQDRFACAVKPATSYSISVKAFDYDGNSSAATVSTFNTAMPEFDATANLALNKTTSAGGGTAANANDGNDGNGWQAGEIENEWWIVDLGAAYDLREVQMRWETAYATQFRLSTSTNGTEWTTQRTVSRTLNTPNNYEEAIPFLVSNVRYIKYETIERSMDYGANIREFRVYGIDYHTATAAPILTSVEIYDMQANLIPGVAQTVYAIAKNQDGGLFTGANISLAADRAGINITAADTLYNNAFKVDGQLGGNYVITATATSGAITKTKTANVSVTESPRVAEITLSTETGILNNDAAAIDGQNAFPTNYAINISVSCKDQYGAAIATPELTWNTTYGNMSGTTYTTASVGTETLSASCTTTAGVVTSNTIEIKIITAADNIALNKTAIGNETSTNPENAIDGNFNSMWEQANVADANNIYDAWLSVDLGALYNIALVEVIWEGASSKTFTVDYSTDGSIYTSKYSITNNPNMRNVYNRMSGETGSARYVRVHNTEAGTVYGIKIRELRVYGTADGTSTTIATTADGMNDICIYPNPAQEQIRILSNNEQENTELTIYNVTGQTMYSHNGINTTVNISDWNAGTYFVKIINENGNQKIGKFVKK